jgi:hypothetical protein
MKTKSIASIVAVLGASVVLNLSALAGPGPQPQFQTRHVSTQQSVPAPAGKVGHEPTIAFGGTKSAPTLVTVTGPRGNAYLYR